MVRRLRPRSPVITGTLVSLAAEERDYANIAQYVRWFRDPEVRRTSAAGQEAWDEAHVARLFRRIRHPPAYHFFIYDQRTGSAIGDTALETRLQQHGGDASIGEFSIMIGEPDFRGRGYGTEATRLMLDYGFSDLGLRQILLSVFDFNERARRLYRRMGFGEAGEEAEVDWLHGTPCTLLTMRLQRDEFYRQGV